MYVLLWAVVLACFSCIICVPVAAPGSRFAATKDMGTEFELDSRAVQGLLRRLWEYEAETWKEKYEATEKKRVFLEQRLEGLVSDLRKCEESAPLEKGREGGDEKPEDQTRSEGDKLAKNDEYDYNFLILLMGKQEGDVTAGDNIHIKITSPHNDDVTVHVTQNENVELHEIPSHGVVQVPLNNHPHDNVVTFLNAEQPVKAEVMTADESVAEEYIVIPISSLSKDYILKEVYPYALVSTADNTRVKVQDSTGSVVYSLLLNQGQTFLTPTGKSPSLAGGSISAQNPLAVLAARPTQCNNGGCSASDLQVLRSNRLNIKAWNDCLASPNGCNEGRPRPG